jgi:non-heme chloroperoxidase
MFRELPLAIFLCCGVAAAQQPLTGDWQGTLDSDSELRLVLHVDAKENGSLKAAIFTIDQSPDEIPATTVHLKNGVLTVSFALLQAEFTGHFDAGNTRLTGKWVQGDTTPLTLIHVAGKARWHQFQGKVLMVPAGKDVQLEVIDWGGSGQPLVFLAGLGNTAHIFDQFAPQFTSQYHVLGITRKGFGFSSSPVPDGKNYSADRLAEDDLEVMDRLHLKKPIVVGHSIAGEELSSIASRYPSRISGLIYLEAGYAYACYDSSRGDVDLDAIEVRRKIDQLLPGSKVAPLTATKQLLDELPRLEKDLEKQQADLSALSTPPEATPSPSAQAEAIWKEQQIYTTIPVPALAIFAVPHDNQGSDSAAKAQDLEKTTSQSGAFRRCAPQAQVLKIPNANHYLFLTNEPEVLADMKTFLAQLSR